MFINSSIFFILKYLPTYFEYFYRGLMNAIIHCKQQEWIRLQELRTLKELSSVLLPVHAGFLVSLGM